MKKLLGWALTLGAILFVGHALAGPTAPAEIDGGVYNLVPPTLADKQSGVFQLTSDGSLKISGTINASSAATATAAAPTYIEGTSNPLSQTLSGELRVDCVTGCAGGSFNNNSDNVATSATNGQSAAWNYVWDGAAWDRLYGDSTNGSFVNVKTSVLPTGAATSALQTTINTTLGSPFQAGGSIGNTTFAVTQATGTNLHAVLDSGTLTTVSTVTALTGGSTAADAAAAAINPLLTGCYASAAAPSDMSADNDATREWCLRNGARATVLTAAGALIGGDAANGLDVDVTRLSALVAGAAIIGKVGIDQTTPGTTNLVQVTDGAGALNVIVDSGAINATLAAETTKVIGTVRNLGNVGAVFDGVNTAATAPANGILGLGIYNSTEPSPTTGQSVGIQLDSKGRTRGVIMDAAGNTRGANVNASNQLSVSVDNTVTVGTHAVTIASGGVASGAIASGAYASGSIGSGAIASGAVASGAYAAGSIAAGAYVSGSILSGALASGAVVDITNVSMPITPATATATKTIGLGAEYRSTLPTWTNTQQGALQVGTRGALHVELWNSDSATVNPVGSGNATGALRVELANNGTGLVGLNAGTNGIGKLTSNSGVTIGAVELAAAQTLATVTTVTTLTNTTALTPGTGATNLGKAEDQALTSGDVGVMALAVQIAAPADSAADNDYSPLQMKGGALFVQPVPGTANGLTAYVVEPGASDNHVVIKAGAGTVYHVFATTKHTAAQYMRLYNATTGFNGCNSATNLQWEGIIPAASTGAGLVEDIGMGLSFATGISICVTGAYGNTDTTNATASVTTVNVMYK